MTKIEKHKKRKKSFFSFGICGREFFIPKISQEEVPLLNLMDPIF